jgi:pimeloyl-ACP methyl ester carboxylesterase
VDDLRGLLDHLELRQAVLVAQSMGGATCLGFTLRYPERVRALVMCDTLGGITAPGRFKERQEEVRKATQDLSQADRVVARSFQQREPARTQLYLELASFNATNRFTLRGGGPSEPPTPEQLAGLKMPILFLVGQEDVLAPPDIVRMGQEMVPGSQFVEIPNAGHSAYFERPEVFNETLCNFLKTAGIS